MLQKDRISGLKAHSDEWKQARLGKFTSSKIISILQDKENASGFKSYIYQKVAEELTGVPVDDDESLSEINAIRWGLMHEVPALERFGKAMGIEYLLMQQLITVPGTRYGCTPDALIVNSESQDQTAFDVATVEVKCFPTYVRYMELALCSSPLDVKKANSTVFWQVLDQMENCDCLKGYLVIYHPDFKAGQLVIIEFRKIELVEELKFLKYRKFLATQRFEEVRDSMIKLGKVKIHRSYTVGAIPTVI